MEAVLWYTLSNLFDFCTRHVSCYGSPLADLLARLDWSPWQLPVAGERVALVAPRARAPQTV